MRSGKVYFDNRYAGDIEETKAGMSFRYREEWVGNDECPAIALRIPKRSEVFEWSGPSPFFMGLLPEGWLHELAIDRFRIQADDWFGQILALCKDCVGAVHVEENS